MLGLMKGRRGAGGIDQHEQMLIDVAVKRVDVCLERLKTATLDGNASEVEAISRVMVDLMRNPRLPNDKTKEAQIAVRIAERDVFVKACDSALKRAIEFAQADQGNERNAELRAAQDWLKKAITAGASPDYRTQTQYKIDIIMETGGVRQKGPTAAKPLDLNKISNRAKA